MEKLSKFWKYGFERGWWDGSPESSKNQTKNQWEPAKFLKFS